MAKKFTLNELKDLKGKTLYSNINGKVVACRFTRLEVYLSGQCTRCYNNEYANHYRYVLEHADGSKCGEYYATFPKLYYTIDDCISGENCLGGTLIHQFAPFEDIMCETETHNDCLGHEVTWALTWKRNKKTLEIGKTIIGQCRYDVIENKFYVGCGPEYKESVCYKTREECAKNSPIEVITF